MAHIVAPPPVSRTLDRRRVVATMRSSTPTGRPTDPGLRRPESGLAVIWLAASVIPYVSRMGMPVFASNRAEVGTGRGAEAERMNRMRVRDRFRPLRDRPAAR